MSAIFLSASVPLVGRGNYHETADPFLIQCAVRELVMAVIQDNPSIPQIEQIVSAGAAAQNMLVAAHALGLGGFWRTGAAAYDPVFKKALGASEKDVIVGVLYLGNVATAGKESAPNPKGVVAEWNG